MENEDSEPVQLGAIVSQLEFPEAERKRIADCVKHGDVQADILKRFARQTNPYKYFSKREQIPGFRRTHSSYFPQALRRIGDYLGMPSHRLAWDIYRASVVEHIIVDHPTLDTLLGEVDAPAAHDSEALLRSIAEHAFEYDVSPEDIRALYEVWGFERLDNFQAILDSSSKQSAAAVDRKRLLELRKAEDQTHSAVVELEHRFESFAESADERVRRLESNSNDATSTLDQLNRIQEQLEALEGRLDQSEIERNQSASRTISIDQLIRSIQQDLGEIRVRQEAAELVVSESQADLGHRLSSLESSTREREAAARDRIDQIENSLLDLSVALEDLHESGAAGASPGQLPDPSESTLRHRGASTKTGISTTSEESLIAALMSARNTATGRDYSFAYAAALQRTLLSNRAIVCSFDIARSWLELTGWLQRTESVVASPTWSSETDWASGIRCLLQHQPDQPRIVLIHDYDVGILEAYLVPFLVLWHREQPIDPTVKLILIPSGQDVVESPRLRQFTTDLGSAYSLAERIRLDASLPSSGKLPPAESGSVEVEQARSWFADYRAVAAFESLESLESDFGVDHELRSRVQSTARHVARYLDANSAMAWAVASHVLPWLEARGDETLIELLRTKFDL